MQIQLKQAEIIEALKQYITKQGISLSNKSVDITFKAGRGDSGLSADIVIDEQGDIPGFTQEAEDAPTTDKPALTVVQSTTAAKDAVEVAPSQDEAQKADEEAATPAATTSLFG